MLRVLAAASMLAWMTATPVASQTTAGERFRLAGSVELLERGQALASAEDVAVYFRPEVAVAVEPAAEPYVVSTFRKQFEPRVLTMEAGGTVRFPNRDPILHNVFSLSPGNAFDLGLVGPGEGDAYRFEGVGLVRVYCNVHQAMVAHVLVLDTPFHLVTGTDGRFELTGLPEGPGTLYVWHEQARRPWSQALTLPFDGAIEATLETSARKVPNHTNKFGKPYRRGRDRDRRY